MSMIIKDRIDGSQIKGLSCKDKSLTKQAFKDECDINKIIERYDRTGMITNLNKNKPFYGDVSELGGLQEAFDKVNLANELFMQMSAKVRNRFDNNPVKMVEFLSDDANKSEAKELGLIVADNEPKPTEPVSEVKPEIQK